MLDELSDSPWKDELLVRVVKIDKCLGRLIGVTIISLSLLFEINFRWVPRVKLVAKFRIEYKNESCQSKIQINNGPKLKLMREYSFNFSGRL